ncbi:hypothetical protein MBLNU457_3471t1 [Dothideomycetes sp. NU457]
MANVKTEVVDTTKQISDLVDWLCLCHAQPELRKPNIYIDLEGVKLSRHGTLSILTLLINTVIEIRRPTEVGDAISMTPTTSIYIIDVHSLGTQAFNTPGIQKTTLKDVLQDERIPKVFFDVRNDSDALFAHFGVELRGIQDLQLLESATRTTTRSRKFLSSLAKCVADLAPDDVNTASWKLAKEAGPISEQIVAYCVGDVQCLPKLWNSLQRQTTVNLIIWRDLVSEETKKRVAASQKPEYEPHGPGRALAPWNGAQNKLLNEWNQSSRPDGRYDEGSDWFDDIYEDINCDDDDFWDDGRMSCRDIINDWDYHLYYSD